MIDLYVFHVKIALCNWIIWGIPILIIFGFIMHYLYEWSGNSKVVGVFAPINESVWEHLKLTFWPMLIWWLAGYCIYDKSHGDFTVQWFVSCAAAQIFCFIVILSFYYTYTGSLGIKSLILDIFSLILGVAAGQGLALHIFEHAKFEQYWLYEAVIVLDLLVVAFTLFTFDPPHIPLFKDSSSGKYGI